MVSSNVKNGFWIVVAVIAGLYVIGLAGSGGATSTVDTPASRSAWCAEHADDPWSGQYDEVTRRYMDECV